MAADRDKLQLHASLGPGDHVLAWVESSAGTESGPLALTLELSASDFVDGILPLVDDAPDAVAVGDDLQALATLARQAAAIVVRQEYVPDVRFERAADGESRLMGFGHPVYTTMDPRSIMLGEIADGIGGPQVELARVVEQTCLDLLEEFKPGRGLKTNVEFYAALVMRSSGIPDELFTPTFAVSRVIGWTANIREQVTEDNRIFRPSAQYVGPEAPQPVPALG